MAKIIETHVEIAAPAERVWEILTDFAAYPEWNPFITKAAGHVGPGATIRIWIRLMGSSSMPIKTKLLIAEPNKELRWVGRLLIPGIFDGEHYFRIISLSEGSVRFDHGETFSGLLVPLFGGILEKAKRGYEEMNKALKQRAENIVDSDSQ